MQGARQPRPIPSGIRTARTSPRTVTTPSAATSTASFRRGPLQRGLRMGRLTAGDPLP